MHFLKLRKILLALLLYTFTVGSAQSAMPGMKGPDHFGITVPDLNQAVYFFVNIIGCETFYKLGPFSDSKGDGMKKHLNVHPRAEIRLFS